MKDLVWILWVMGWPIFVNISELACAKYKKISGIPQHTHNEYLFANFVHFVIYVWVWVKLV